MLVDGWARRGDGWVVRSASARRALARAVRSGDCGMRGFEGARRHGGLGALAPNKDCKAAALGRGLGARRDAGRAGCSSAGAIGPNLAVQHTASLTARILLASSRTIRRPSAATNSSHLRSARASLPPPSGDGQKLFPLMVRNRPVLSNAALRTSGGDFAAAHLAVASRAASRRPPLANPSHAAASLGDCVDGCGGGGSAAM
jgi:hypothetical protein